MFRYMAKYRNELPEVLAVLKAVADENRLRVMNVLKKGELCVCQITALLALAPSTVSKHMSILKQHGLVESRKEGRWIYYRLAAHNGRTNVAEIRALLHHLLQNDEQASVDLQSIMEIQKIDPEKLCRK
ncbi:metalloregulator ArsR/SmtB family transcription factor [Oligoflexia bacterium]|nr:metalloregulator ArsR/SmtB family transcription factor [Oligoflexia bacterium]